MNDSFEEIIDQKDRNPSKVERVVFCTGKVFYDLLAKQEELKDKGEKVSIVRVEQMYPFPKEIALKLFERYRNAKSILWTQEEPMNMGAWFFMRARLEELCQKGQTLVYNGRKGSGSTAEGSLKAHVREQTRIVEAAFELS